MSRITLLLAVVTVTVLAQNKTHELLSNGSCGKVLFTTAVKTSLAGIMMKPTGEYAHALHYTATRKSTLRRTRASADSVETFYTEGKTLLEECIVQKLIPFWYGTEWDFEGHTNIPRKGRIACGYFVSTVLTHCGFNLNRYRLAQQGPYYEAITLQLNDSVKIFDKGSADFIRGFSEKFGDGLYFVGLENHVGFLLLSDDSLFFIHSSYVPPLCVVAEDAHSSVALSYSRYFIVAELSTNKKLIDCWVNNTEIKVKKPE